MEYLNEMYDKYMAQKYNLKPSTRNNYIYCYDHFVRDTFGKRRIATIKYSDVKEFYNWLMFEQGMKANTLDNVHTQLHPTFDLAVRDDLIRKNPSDGVMTEIKKNSAAFRRQRHALTAPQQKAFMNHLCNNYEFHGWEPVITVLLGTGMRIGECLGLCWSDLDFEKRIIKVCKTLTYRPEPNNGCVVHVSTPKTEAGERTIPMIDEVYDAFLEEYQIQKVLGFGNNEIDGFSGFVFSTGEGNVYTPESVNRAIKRIYDDYNKNEKAINEEVRNKRCNKSHSTSVVRYYSCTHYFLFIRGAGPVNDGDFGNHYNQYSISNIDHKHIKWIYKNGLWNDIYQTNNNILIKKLIKLYFDEYKIYKNNNMQMS